MVFSVLQFLLSPSPPMLPSEQLYSICTMLIQVWEGKQTEQLMYYDLRSLVLCQIYSLSLMIAKTASKVQTMGWNEVTETMSSWDVNYLIPFVQDKVLAFVYFYFLVFRLPCNMPKNYSFIFNTFACSLPFWRAKNTCTCLTPLSCLCRGQLIGPLQLFYVAW